MAHSPIDVLANTLVLVMIHEGDEAEVLMEMENLADPIIIVSNLVIIINFINLSTFFK